MLTCFSFDSTREARIVLDKGQGILIDGSVIYFEVPVQLRPVAFPDDGHSRGNYHRPPFQGHGGLGSRPLPGIPTAYHPTNVPHDNSYSDWSADGRSSRSSSAVPHFDQRQNTGRVPVYAADASDVPRLYQPHASGMGPPDYRQAGDRTFARASSRQRDYQRQASKNSQRPGSEHSTPRKKHNKIGKNKNNWQQERDRVESDWNTASVSLPNNPRADSRLGEHDNDTGPVVSDPVNAWQDKTVKEQVNEGATQLELLPVSTSLPSSEGFQTLEDQGAVPYPASEIDNEQACEASSPTISTALPVPDQSSGTGQTTAGTKTAEVGLAEDVSTTSLEEISKMPADVRKSPTVAAAKVDTEIDTSLVTTPEKQEVQLDTNVVSEIPLKRVATPGGASAHPIARKSSRSFTPRRRDFSSPKNGDDVDDSFQTAVETPESTRSVSMPVTPSLAAGVKPAIRVESSESDNAPVSGLSELPAPMQAGTQLTSSILTPSVSDDGTDTTVFNSPASTITGKSPTVAEPHIKKTTILTGPKQTESLSPFGRPVQSKKRDKKKKQAKNKEKSKSDTKSQDSVPEGSSKLHTGETDPPGLGIKAANQPLPGIPQSDGPAGTLALHSHQYKESKPQSTTLSKKRQPPTESKSSGGLVGAVTANFPWVFGSKHHDQIRSTKDDDASKLERSKPAAELPKTDKSGKCQALDVDLHADLGPTPIQTPLSQQNDVGTTIESGPFPEQHIHKSGKPNDDTNTSTTRPGSEASAPGSPKSKKQKARRNKSTAGLENDTSETQLVKMDNLQSMAPTSNVQSVDQSGPDLQVATSEVIVINRRPRIPTPSNSSGIIEAPKNKLAARKQKQKSRHVSMAEDAATLQVAGGESISDDTQEASKASVIDMTLFEKHKENKRKKPDDLSIIKLDDKDPVAESQFKIQENDHKERMLRLSKQGDTAGMEREKSSWNEVKNLHDSQPVDRLARALKSHGYSWRQSADKE